MTVLNILQQMEIEIKASIFIVGGYVRDYLQNIKNIDIDAVVIGVSTDQIVEYLAKFGKIKKIVVQKNISNIDILQFEIKTDEYKAQLTVLNEVLPLKEILLKDALRRDFTINAMYMPINNIDESNIIDLVNGKQDFQNKIINTVKTFNETFIESPIRLLRIFSLAAKTNFKISYELKQSIYNNRYLLNTISVDSIKIELEKILLSKQPSRYLKLMNKTGIIELLIPELHKCTNCTQDKKYHKYSVFNHLLLACDYSEPNIVARLAALFHDIGKPLAKKIINGRITFHKHEVLSEKETGIILKRLHFSNKIIEKVTHLVRMHMYHYTREYTDAGIRRFIINSGLTSNEINTIEEFPLFKLRQADRIGNGYRKEVITNRQRDFENRIKEVFYKSNGYTIKDLKINGDILIQEFNLSSGKQIGKLLDYLLNIIIEDPSKNTKENLLNIVQHILNKVKPY